MGRARPQVSMLTALALAAAILAAAELGERALGLPPPFLGRPRAGLDGLATGLLTGALARGVAELVGMELGEGATGASVVLVPIAEERLFRGLLSRALGPIWSSGLFALAHARDLESTVALFGVGILLARVFRIRGLVASTTLHAGLNVSALSP